MSSVNEACLAVNHYLPYTAIDAEGSTKLQSLFTGKTLVHNPTPPLALQTTNDQGADTGATRQSIEQRSEIKNRSFMSAAIRPAFTVFNASVGEQGAIYHEEGNYTRLLGADQLEDLQIQILNRTPVLKQTIEPQKLTAALILSFSLAIYGWKIGSQSGLKCCVFLLFLVYFRLRSMHDTPN